MSEVNNCPNCSYQLMPEWFFCPNCGKVLKEKPITISLFKQVLIYLVSFFLAPLGMAWGLKYIRSKNVKTKIVGIICILLTVVSVSFMIYAYKNFMDQYMKTLNSIHFFY